VNNPAPEVSAAGVAAPAAAGYRSKCRQGHDLKPASRSARCDECSANIGKSLNCSTCDYDMCDGCDAKAKTAHENAAAAAGAAASSAGAARPAQCPGGHPLASSSSSARCDECSSNISSSMKCKKCDYDICEACQKTKFGVASAGAAAVTAAPANPRVSPTYQSTTGEKYLMTDDNHPVGSWDASNRQCNTKLREVLNRWNEWSKDFNEAYCEARKHEGLMKVQGTCVPFLQASSLTWLLQTMWTGSMTTSSLTSRL
jgi:hypothetical protein